MYLFLLHMFQFLSTRKRIHPGDDDNDEVYGGDVQKKATPGTSYKQGYHSGTTAVVGILREDDFIVANAGDSKCVLASKGTYVYMLYCICVQV